MNGKIDTLDHLKEVDHFDDFDALTAMEESEEIGFGAGYDLHLEVDDRIETAADYQVIGPDTRKRIRSTRNVPFRYICKLQIRFPDGSSGGCTGTLVGPNKVLTSAHCLKKGQMVARHVRVIPGKNGPGRSPRSEPFGAALSSRLHIPAQYRKPADSYDYAVITLDRPIGRRVGWWRRIRALPDRRLLRRRLNTAGYPGDQGGDHQYWAFDRVVSVRGRRIEYLNDTYKGQSGSPVWLRWRNFRSIVAIHAARDDPNSPPVANRGVHITPGVLRDIRRWLRA